VGDSAVRKCGVGIDKDEVPRINGGVGSVMNSAPKLYSIRIGKDEMGDILTLINNAINDCYHKREYPAIVYQAVKVREDELFELRREVYEQLGVSDEAEFWEKAEETE